MGEVRTTMTPVQVSFTCEECPEGYMVPTGTVKACNPPKHEHVCNQCGNKMLSFKRYPYIDFVVNGEEPLPRGGRH